MKASSCSSCSSSSGPYKRLDWDILLENICPVRAVLSGKTGGGSWYRPFLTEEERGELSPTVSKEIPAQSVRAEATSRQDPFDFLIIYQLFSYLQLKPQSEVKIKHEYKSTHCLLVFGAH